MLYGVSVIIQTGLKNYHYTFEKGEKQIQKILKTLGVVKDVLGSKVRGMCIPTGSSVCKSVGGHGC